MICSTTFAIVQAHINPTTQIYENKEQSHPQVG